jgi:hypothetical protein
VVQALTLALFFPSQGFEGQEVLASCLGFFLLFEWVKEFMISQDILKVPRWNFESDPLVPFISAWNTITHKHQVPWTNATSLQDPTLGVAMN